MLASRFGVAVERSLTQNYQQSWIMDQDLDRIAAGGFNLSWSLNMLPNPASQG